MPMQNIENILVSVPECPVCNSEIGRRNENNENPDHATHFMCYFLYPAHPLTNIAEKRNHRKPNNI